MSADLNKKPKLAVGQVWKNGYGEDVTISNFIDGDTHPWVDSEGETYKDCGSYYNASSSMSDLVELVRDVHVQPEGDGHDQGLHAVLNKHKAICMHFKHTDEFLEFKYGSAKELDDCIVFYGTDCTPGWGSTSVFYKSEIVCMHFAEEGANDE